MRKTDSLSQIDDVRADKNEFLHHEQKHIMQIASKITKHYITASDDEWSIAMLAVSQALDSYHEEKGEFWPYAALVMKSRLTDYYRSQSARKCEIFVQPSVFDGELDEEESNIHIQYEIQEHMGCESEPKLKEEIDAVGQELSQYGFSFFDLAECSPKTKTTRTYCARAVRALFTPPPLIESMYNRKCFPVKEILLRTGLPKRIVDRHRRYLIAAAVILAGDYPELSEYLHEIKKEETS